QTSAPYLLLQLGNVWGCETSSLDHSQDPVQELRPLPELRTKADERNRPMLQAQLPLLQHPAQHAVDHLSGPFQRPAQSFEREARLDGMLAMVLLEHAAGGLAGFRGDLGPDITTAERFHPWILRCECGALRSRRSEQQRKVRLAHTLPTPQH